MSVLKFAFALGVLLALGAGGAAAQSEKPKLTVYTYDSFTGEYGPGATVKERFEATCGCTLEWVATDDAGTLHPAKHERPDEKAPQDDPDDAWETDPLDEERADEDHDRGDEERPLRGRRGELDAEEHARSVQLAPDGEPSRAGLRGSEISEFARRR